MSTLTPEEVRTIWNDLELGDWIEGAEDFATAIAIALRAKWFAEPYAYELHLPNDEYELAYPAYLERYATSDERDAERFPLYAAPQEAK